MQVPLRALQILIGRVTLETITSEIRSEKDSFKTYINFLPHCYDLQFLSLFSLSHVILRVAIN